MYVPTEVSTFIAVDVSMPSSYGVAIERRGIPHPNPMRLGYGLAMSIYYTNTAVKVFGCTQSGCMTEQ
nr:unnamed protein product [Digitaria exilis]